MVPPRGQYSQEETASGKSNTPKYSIMVSVVQALLFFYFYLIFIIIISVVVVGSLRELDWFEQALYLERTHQAFTVQTVPVLS